MVLFLFGKKVGNELMNDIQKFYDQIAQTYDEKYVFGGLDNPYMVDEYYANLRWQDSRINGSIVSLGVGTGQDVEILGFPHHEKFVGYDFSIGMINRARMKFSKYRFQLHDCNDMIVDTTADVLVCMFGAANYLGATLLKKHYQNLKCRSAFFVFYNERYQDGIVDSCYMYTHNELMDEFKAYSPTVIPLFDGSNYNVVWWNEN
jgi:ubiquinone/menaquinone biosynthesis C-methylase UbiE